MSPRNLEREARVLILLLLPLVPPSLRASSDARFGCSFLSQWRASCAGEWHPECTMIKMILCLCRAFFSNGPGQCWKVGSDACSLEESADAGACARLEPAAA